MAMRLGKRKAPKREKKQIKRGNPIAGGVFEDKTVDALINLLNSKKIDSLDFPVSGGKEAIVFRATKGNGYRAVKVFKYENTSFRKMMDYVEGDPRFYKPSKQKRPLVKLWARKEYANLNTCFDAGVPVPKPFLCRENVLLMEFLGVGGIQSATLDKVIVQEPEETLESIAEGMHKMHCKAGIVHADLSEYNIVVHEGKPVFIDLAQGVSVKHPRAGEWLEKDCRNVARFFSRLGVKITARELLARTTNKKV
jgi:RIO kinase 1